MSSNSEEQTNKQHASEPVASGTLAKLARPSTPYAVLRTRLHKQIEANAHIPVLWISGPPGCGKTTLVASYLAGRTGRGFWYQMDSADSDVATLFYYLGRAIKRVKRSASTLSLLTPDHLPRLEPFTRRFARDLFAQLPPESYLVFDNYHELPNQATTHQVLAWLCSEIPRGVQAIVISRTDPPKEFSQAVANSTLTLLGWNELRLTREETRQIAAARGPLTSAQLDAIHAYSNGWAAGLVLLLEDLRRRGHLNSIDEDASIDNIFNYFEVLISTRLNDELQDFLMRTSVLSFVNQALAVAVTGRTDALSLLKELEHRQFFVQRSQGRVLTYQYHGLLRAFLQKQARRKLTAEDWKQLLLRSAAALSNHGHEEEALELYLKAEAWEQVPGSIQRMAPALLRQGRWQTLLQWIERVPDGVRENQPWLGYWLGMCWLRIDLSVARQHLEPAFDRFRSRSNKLGEIITAATIIEAIISQWTDCNRLEYWIETVERSLAQATLSFPSRDAELTVRASLLNACIHRQSMRTDLSVMANVVLELLGHDVDADIKLTAARALFLYGAHTGDYCIVEQAMRLTQAAFDSEQTAPANRAWYAARCGWALRYVLATEDCRCWFKRATEIASQHELVSLDAPIAYLRIWAEDVFGDEDLQRQLLQALEQCTDPKSIYQAGFLHICRMFVAVQQRDLDWAVVQLQQALSSFRRSSYRFAEAFTLIALAFLQLRRQHNQEARSTCEELVALALHPPLFRYITALIQALLAVRIGDKECAVERLRSAFTLGGEHGFWRVLGEAVFRPLLVELAAFALAHGVAPDYVERLIQTQGLPAPAVSTVDWPWPMRMYGLGSFALEHQGQALRFSGKVSKKPIELLKMLLAAGEPGIDVKEAAGMLWPDTEGDASANVFRVTHLRLRKLLPSGEWLVQNEGNLRLNSALVWTDVSAFEARLSDCFSHLDGHAGTYVVLEDTQNLLRLYQGDLLMNESDEPWILDLRGRLRSRFFRCLKALGTYWETRHEWNQAQTIYEHAIEHDPTAEFFYRRLIACHIRSGYPSEAIRTYHRCRLALFRAFGIAPSAETEALLQRIQTQLPER